MPEANQMVTQFPPPLDALSDLLGREKEELIRGLLAEHELSVPEGMRIALHIFAAALPVLARGGQLVFREPRGEERAYEFPGLQREA